MTEFIPQSAPVGTVAAIPNALASGELNTTILVDPLQIQAYRESIANQLNAQSGGPSFEDLSDRISGIQIETSAQGASILVVTLVDPMWVLPMSGFIQVDADGYLWPPIDVNFPTDTDCVWRLCQYRAIWDADMSSPNLTLTFEDRIASLLREMSPIVNGGIAQGEPNQTLGGFIKELVDGANQQLRAKIRLVELISPQDPNYTPPINQLPTSAQAPLGKQPLRNNPNKDKQGLTAAQTAVITAAQAATQALFAGTSRISEVEAIGAAKIAQLAGLESSPDQGGLAGSGGAGSAP